MTDSTTFPIQAILDGFYRGWFAVMYPDRSAIVVIVSTLKAARTLAGYEE